jgi:hypothetical protein
MTTKLKVENRRYWTGYIPSNDDFGLPIYDTFYDGKTSVGPWAFMSERSWRTYGIGQTGTGLGQKYAKQADGQWLKVEG